MTDEQKKRCHEIIHAASISAADVGAGAASIPVVGWAAVAYFDK